MFGGYETVEEFDNFFASFEIVLKSKLEMKKED